MRALVAVLACAACAAPPAPAASTALVASTAENCLPESPCERAFWRGDLCVREPLADGSACLAGADLCPGPGMCREGQCVSARLVKPEPIAGSQNIWAGWFAGPAFDDGSIAFFVEGLDDVFRVGPGHNARWSDPKILLVTDGIALGGSVTQLVARDAADGSLRWMTARTQSAPGVPGGLPVTAEARAVDLGGGLVVVLSGGYLFWVQLSDGLVVRALPVAGKVNELVADEERRLYLLVDDTPCRLDALAADGTPRWSVETACQNSWRPTLRTFGGRLYEERGARATSDGHRLPEIDDKTQVLFATPEVVVSQKSGALEFRDPSTLALRARRADGGTPFAITHRGTVLSSVLHYVAEPWCKYDCGREVGELVEWTFDGAATTQCDQLSFYDSLLSNGVVWTSWTSDGPDGVKAWRAGSLTHAERGWVAPYGTPGAGRRPR